MTAYQVFKKISLKSKIKTINKQGAFVDSRRAYGCVVRLFAIHDFYVEVWSSRLLPWRNIIHIRSFKKCDKLMPYLNRVDIQALLSHGSLYR